MNPEPAAALSTSLLVTKGNAQPSRGLAQPAVERIVFGGLGMAAPVGTITVPQATSSERTARRRITISVDERQWLRIRLACAHLYKSRQTILLSALEHYLDRVLPKMLRDPCPCIEGGTAESACRERIITR